MKYHITLEGKPNECHDTSGRCPYKTDEHIYADNLDELRQKKEAYLNAKHNLFANVQKNMIKTIDLSQHPFAQKGLVSAFQVSGKIRKIDSTTHTELRFSKIKKLDNPTAGGSTSVLKIEDPDVIDIYNNSQSEISAANFTVEEAAAMRMYSTRDFKFINKGVATQSETLTQIQENKDFLAEGRKKYEFLSEEEKTAENLAAIVNNIDKALEKGSNIQRTVYRGVTLTESSKARLFGDANISDGEVQKYLHEKYKLGATIEETSYGSSSLQPSVGNSYGRDTKVMLEIKTRSGINITSNSDYVDESEVLIPRNTKYKVIGHHRNVKVNQTEGMTIIQLIEVDDEDNII